QKSYVTKLSTLTAAEKRIEELKVIEADKAVAQPVIDQIAALPSTITLNNESAVNVARAAYEGLTDTQKTYVTNYSKLTSAESKIAQLKAEKADKEAAQGVIDAIAILPAKITLAHKVIVNAVRSSYDALTDAQKAYVTNYSTLTAAEKAIQDLEDGTADKEVAKAVVDQIAALPATITLSHKSAVQAARKAYNALTDAQKAYVTNLSKLVAAENTIVRLEAAEADKALAATVQSKIAALPSTITLDHKSAVQAARTAYNGLTDSQKGYVTNLSKLEAAEATIAALDKQAQQEAADKAAAKTVTDKIAALPATIALSDKSAVQAARTAYNALTDVQKGYVTNLSKLTAAEKAITDLEKVEADKAAAKVVTDKIAALPATIALSDKANVQAARTAYTALTDAQKGYVTNLAKLAAAEQAIKDLEAVEADKAVAKSVDDVIAALPATITKDDTAAIAAARAAYEGLTDAQKAFITNLDKLAAAEKALKDLDAEEADKAVAKVVDELIGALTGDDNDAIRAARDAYNALTEAQKAFVTKLADLQAAEKAMEDEIVIPEAPADVVIDYGDVDGDGMITATDALEILKSVVGKVQFTAEQAAAADTDANGAADAADALNVLKKVVGKISEFPAAGNAAAVNQQAADGVIAKINDIPADFNLDYETELQATATAYGALTATQRELVTNVAALTSAIDRLADLKVAQYVVDRINALSDPVKLDEKDAVVAARNTYNALTDGQKALVPNLAKLTTAEEAIPGLEEAAANQAAAQLVIARIDALSDPVVLEEKSAVQAARAAYEALTDAQKALVANLTKLQAAEAAIPVLEKQAADKAAAQVVIDRIAAISDTVTLNDKVAIENARAAYEALTDDQKALVENINKLTTAETRIPVLEQEAADKAAAQVVVDQIAALSSPITLAEKSAVQAARAAYNGLTDAQKGYVTNYNALTAAETRIPVLEQEAADKAVAQIVIDLIAALPVPVTVADSAAVDNARAAYEGLTDAQQDYVINYGVLVEAERVIAESAASNEDLEAAQAVIDTIEMLPANITLSNKTLVTATRDMYDALTDLQKALVTNLTKLEAAEAKVAQLEAIEADKEAAKTVDDMIDALPATITLSHKTTVAMTRSIYEALTDAQKAYVTKLSKLEAAEATLAQLDKDAANQAAAQAVIDKIAALPATITLNNKNAVTAARTAYNALTSTQKNLVTNLSKLTAAEATITNLEKVEADKAAAQVVIDQINALPATITLSNKSAVTAARTAYKALTTAQQGYVTNLSKLTAAETTIANLEKVEADKAAAAAVDTKIAAIGTLTADNFKSKASTITAARTAYDALTDAQKAYVTKLSVLTAAEKEYARLLEESQVEPQPEDPANPVISAGYQSIPQLQNVSAYATPVSPIKNNLSFNTLTQINQTYSKLYDLDVDCVLAYEYGMPDDTSGGLAASWVLNKHTYTDNTTIGLMIAVNRDNAEYLENYGKSRGVADIQTKADGTLRSHSVLNNKTIYYMVPTNSYLDYKWQVIDKYLQSGKIKVVALEEPEMWNECGYSAGYKELYQQYYGTSWVDPASSAEAMWKNQQCKAWAFKNAFEVLSSKIKAKYPNVKVLVTTHGPLSYMQHGVATGASMYANISTIDGVIGQTWSDDASQQFMYAGNRVGNVFMNAMYAYNGYGELMSDGKALYLLQDPASDNGAIAKEDMEENWKQTVVAAMMQNDTTSFQSTIWPQRAFTAMGMDYKTIQLSVNKMYQEFSNSDMYGAVYAATPGVALAVSDSMGWHLGSSNVVNGHSK
ncbi:MAG: hypothetical protein IKU10_06305, partial [Clostridia bacterium]|nr:hypothetical protein [Clostridia bacterium]